jgi:hypothetical protein
MKDKLLFRKGPDDAISASLQVEKQAFRRLVAGIHDVEEWDNFVQFMHEEIKLQDKKKRKGVMFSMNALRTRCNTHCTLSYSSDLTHTCASLGTGREMLSLAKAPFWAVFVKRCSWVLGLMILMSFSSAILSQYR